MAELDEIDVLAEFARLDIEPTHVPNEKPQVKIKCPFHDDEHPSCYVFLDSRSFLCRAAGCKAHGDIISLIARIKNCTRHAVINDLSSRYVFAGDKIVEPSVIENWHAALWQVPEMLAELYKRGITDSIIRKRRLGYIEEEKRISIPIPLPNGSWGQVKKYRPNAPDSVRKMICMRGRRRDYLYPDDQLKYDTIMLCGGELKALAAAEQLNPRGIGCISPIEGEGSWNPDFNHRIAGKKIIVCLDIDSAGVKESEAYCAKLYKFAAWIGILTLPLDRAKFPKGDINDYVGPQVGKDLFPLLEGVKQWTPPKAIEEEYGKPEPATLATAMQAVNVGRRLEFPAVLAAVSTAPYAIPKAVDVLCDKSADVCGACPVCLHDKHNWNILPEAKQILNFVGVEERRHPEALQAVIGIPASCRVHEFHVSEFWHAEEIRISPPAQLSSRETERTMQPAIVVGNKQLELNESYKFTGRMFPHPKTAEATLVLSEWETTRDALSTYECKDLDKLKIFRPENEEWTVEGIASRLERIYEDFESNVTRIYQRRDLHLVNDLMYHSALFFYFDEQKVNGWVQALVVGDSSQGKSEISCGSTAAGTGGLMKHYELGAKMECKNATVAGLIGGLQHFGTKWLVTWGAIPNNDKRALIMEELKGMPTEFIAKTTDMRSSGEASLTKIEKRTTPARTRILANSNTRDCRNGTGRQMSSYNFGVEAIVELIGALEDVRRWDIHYIADVRDVDVSVINDLRTNRKVVEHTYTGDLCRSLILWGWTRKDEQVTFDPEAKAAIFAEANRLCARFTEAIPIFDRGSTRFKLARLAVALACRTFSASDDMLSIRVRECHVRYIAKFLDDHYSRPTFGYLEYSRAVQTVSTLRDPEIIKKKLLSLSCAEDVCKAMLYTTNVELQDLQDWSGVDRMQAQDLLSLLVRKNALLRDGRAYRKSAPFISMLSMMIQEGKFSLPPKHITDYKKDSPEF